MKESGDNDISNALEIVTGTGKFDTALARKCPQVTGIELGNRLAEIVFSTALKD